MQSDIPLWLTVSFLALVAWAVLATAFLLDASGAVRSRSRLVLGLGLWLAIPAALAASGLLADFDAMPPRVPLLIFPMAALTIVLASMRLGTAAGAGLSLGTIIGVQAFRIPLELVLHQLYTHGALPAEMTYAGRNFDVLSGLAALALWAWSKRAPLPRALVWVWALGGLGLLINIVTLAVLSFPQPFGWYEPPNTIVAHWPWIWLPSVHVQLALFGHVVVLRTLWKTGTFSSGSRPS
jgi:hypothetical protein